MPNASRYLQAGYTYHLTHRCHDKRFLLRTMRERNDYRKWLREGAHRYKVPIYHYCITSNHTHMVRAGVVDRPSEWRWCGDDELMERRSRYRVLCVERLLESLEMPSMEAFQRISSEGIREQLARRVNSREAVWTESLAVGDRTFVERVATSFGQRRRFSYDDAVEAGPNAFCVREE